MNLDDLVNAALYESGGTLEDMVNEAMREGRRGSRATWGQIDEVEAALQAFIDNREATHLEAGRLYHGTTRRRWLSRKGGAVFHVSVDPEESMEYAMMAADSDGDGDPRLYVTSVAKLLGDNLEIVADQGSYANMLEDGSWLTPHQRRLLRTRPWLVTAEEFGFFAVRGDVARFKASFREVPRVRGEWPSVMP